MPKTPENKLGGTENKEDKERSPRYRTIKYEILETHEDGSKTERVLECNGLLHRLCIDKIFYNEIGDVLYAEQVSREELGQCDCKHF